MIFYLRSPSLLLGLGIGLVAAVVVHNLAQALAARALGDPAARLARQLHADPRKHLEPFGIIAMVVAGLGWGRPVALTEPRSRGGSRGRFIMTLLAGPAAAVLLGLLFLTAYALAGGLVMTVDELTNEVIAAPETFVTRLLFMAAVGSFGVAVLHLVPLPPLDGARIMWALAPATAGWQKARYNLEEQNFGLGILIILLLPIFGGRGLIARIVDAVVGPLFEVFLRLFS